MFSIRWFSCPRSTTVFLNYNSSSFPGKFLPWKNLGCPSQNVELNTVSEWGQAEPRAFESKNDTRGVKLFTYSYKICTVNVYLCTSQSLSHAINHWFKISYL